MTNDKALILTEIVLTIFKLNGALIAAGDQLTGPLGLTSARWQVLGAIALSESPVTVPQIADFMGLTRQGAQKQVDILIEQGLVQLNDNPRHKRSPLCSLTVSGRSAYTALEKINADWMAEIARPIDGEGLVRVRDTLLALEGQITATHALSETST